MELSNKLISIILGIICAVIFYLLYSNQHIIIESNEHFTQELNKHSQTCYSDLGSPSKP